MCLGRNKDKPSYLHVTRWILQEKKKKKHKQEGAAELDSQPGSSRKSGSVLPDPVFLKTKEGKRRKAEKVLSLFRVFSV